MSGVGLAGAEVGPQGSEGQVPGGRVEAAIRSANRDGRPALTAFLTAGYPLRDRFVDTLRSVACVADVVEVGVPFSDPMADGVTIQRASRSALESGVTLPWILSEIERAAVETPIVLMSYLNPLLSFGFDRLARQAAVVGVDGCIIPDLPFEESFEVLEVLEPTGPRDARIIDPTVRRRGSAESAAGVGRDHDETHATGKAGPRAHGARDRRGCGCTARDPSRSARCR